MAGKSADFLFGRYGITVAEYTLDRAAAYFVKRDARLAKKRDRAKTREIGKNERAFNRFAENSTRRLSENERVQTRKVAMVSNYPSVQGVKDLKWIMENSEFIEVKLFAASVVMRLQLAIERKTNLRYTRDIEPLKDSPSDGHARRPR